MANFILIKTVKGGLFLSLKFATFVGLGLGLPTMLNVYRNKTSPVNYIVGMCTCAIILLLQKVIIHTMKYFTVNWKICFLNREIKLHQYFFWIRINLISRFHYILRFKFKLVK